MSEQDGELAPNQLRVTMTVESPNGNKVVSSAITDLLTWHDYRSVEDVTWRLAYNLFDLLRGTVRRVEP